MMPRDVSFPFRLSRPGARARLLCLPYAGGTAVTYRTWAQALPTWIDVCALELPGHGTRMGDARKESMAELVDAVLPAVAQLAPPVAIFGHSMGARLGFELCRALDTKPNHLFASAAPAPDIPRRRRLAHLSQTDLVGELVRTNPASAGVFADAELLQLLLPIVRTDLALVEAYRGEIAPPLDVPITALTGSDDEDVTLDEARAWSRCTTRPFAEPRVFQGGHFFLEEHAARIFALIVEQLG